MTTLTYKGLEYNVILIDPTIHILDADGLTPATAFKDLPDTLTNNTCYLIRRVTGENLITVKRQNDNNLVNVMFLGMPKATDALWIQNLITDDAINSAWKADANEYGELSFTHTIGNNYMGAYSVACLNSANLTNLTAINIYLYRTRPTATSNNAGYYCYQNPMFGNNGIAENKTNFRFYNSKFGTQGINLDSDDYLNNTTSVKSLNDGQIYYSNYSRCYIDTRKANSLIIDNCIINHVSYNPIDSSAQADNNTSYTNQSGYAFKFSSGIRLLSVYNSTINGTGIYHNMSSYQQAIYATNIQKGTIRNLTINHILGDRIIGGGLSLIASFNGRINVSDVVVNFKKFKDYTYAGNDFANLNGGIEVCNKLGVSSVVENITVNGDGDAKIAQGYFVSVKGRGYGVGLPFSSRVNNIKVKLSDNLDQCVFTAKHPTPTSCVDFNYSMGQSSSENWDYSDIYVDNNSYRSRGQLQDYPQIDNLFVDAPYSRVYFCRCVAKIVNLRAGIALSYDNSIDITKLTYDKLANAGISILNDNNYLRVRDYVVDMSIQDGTPQVSTKNPTPYRNAVFIDKSNAAMFNLVATTEKSARNTYAMCFCPNMLATGQFFGRNERVFAQAWNERRMLSASQACLKLYSNTQADSYPLIVGADPYKGFSVMADSAGKKNFICYFAHKNFTATSEVAGFEDFTLEIRVPRKDENGVITHANYFSTEGCWEDDASEWSDANCTAKKMVVPIEVTEPTLPIEIKVTYSWYHTTGFVYLDPEFHIEADPNR